MLYLVTGLPGASKTLNTIKMVNEAEQFQNRPVYYANINDLKIDDWIQLEGDDVLTWYDLPEHSVIIIDEAQYYFKLRTTGKELPKHVLELSTHRHRGYDIFLITQHPTLIDAGSRKFVNKHYHYERSFNTPRPRRLEFEGVANDPKDYHARQNALTTVVKIDKDYFDLYKSTTNNTHKMKLPKFKLFLFAALILLFIFLSFKFYNSISSRGSVDESLPSEASYTSAPSLALPSSSGKPVLTKDQYMALYEPRIPTLPHTAPVYDSLNEPTVRPIPLCIYNNTKDTCVCYTKAQLTTMAVQFELCKQYAINGFFDPAYKPPESGNNSLARVREL